MTPSHRAGTVRPYVRKATVVAAEVQNPFGEKRIVRSTARHHREEIGAGVYVLGVPRAVVRGVWYPLEGPV
jgi:hypothetical protein